jgi:lantibiotic modifying enzyme
MGPCEARVVSRSSFAVTLRFGALLLALAGCAQPPLSSAERDRCRDGARAIGRWLESTAVATEHGSRWPVVPGAEPPRFERSLYAGACGPTLFFLRLAADSKGDERERALEVARAGADELLAALPEKVEGEEGGLYTGIAGVGFTLEEAWRATGEARYRDGARRCVRILHESAQLAGSGIEWSDVTDVIAGSAGIGCFLLDLHLREGDGVALELATRAGRRLLDLSQREAVGRSWRMDPKFPRVMPNFSHGTAGVVYFLARLHETTHAPEFLEAARAGADHLLSIADRSGDGCRIHHHTPDGADLFYMGWCHGPCGTARAFDVLARITGDPRYADAVRGGTTSIVGSALPRERLPGFWNNVSLCCGSAGVIEFLLERARATGDPTLVDRAREFADDLLARGTSDERGLRFVQAEHRVKPDLLEAQTGWMQGAAGIGVALLDLAAFGEDESGRLVLPDGSTGR